MATNRVGFWDSLRKLGVAFPGVESQQEMTLPDQRLGDGTPPVRAQPGSGTNTGSWAFRREQDFGIVPGTSMVERSNSIDLLTPILIPIKMVISEAGSDRI